RLDRNVEVGAELLRLHHGALGQFGARDAGRETQVVLDPGGCTGLPAGGNRVEDDRRESFGSAVHSGGEARRPPPRPRPPPPAARRAGARAPRPGRAPRGGGGARPPPAPPPADVAHRLVL